jgi:nanoRNase/pAp phosphatase (c-di-AMP/oligoRNAs hydrolase)
LNRKPHHKDFWEILLTEDLKDHVYRVSSIAYKGDMVYRYAMQEASDYVKQHHFETVFEGHDATAINRIGLPGQAFDALHFCNPVKIMFGISGKQWVVGLRSSSVDVGEIAKKYGGGGHKNAAGFQCGRLPFDRP